MLGALFQGQGVERIHIKGIGRGEHQSIIRILPLEGALHGRVNRECFTGCQAIHVPVEGQVNLLAALDGGVTLMPHGAIIHHHGRGVAHALEVEILVGGRIGRYGDGDTLAEM